MAKMMLNSILGGQFSSRINLNLREKKGYTYGVSSNFNYYRDNGYFVVSTSVNRENTRNAVDEILLELNKIREGVSPEELSFTRSSVLRKFPASFETNRQIAANVTRLILHSLRLDHFESYPDQVSSVTLPDVNEAAINSIFPERLSVLLVGDKNVILEQFKDRNNILELDFIGNPLSD
jgi:zinc protease